MSWQSVWLCSDSTSSWDPVLNHSAVCVSEIDRVICSESRKRDKETEQTITCSYSICPDIHSAAVLSILCLLLSAGAEKTSAFYIPPLIQKATSVSLHSALVSILACSAVSAEATQACSGSLTGTVIITEVGMECPIFQYSSTQLSVMFNSRMVPDSPLVHTTVATTSYVGPGSG